MPWIRRFNSASAREGTVDDEPAPARELLPYVAECVGAKRPMRIPVWLARPLAGGAAGRRGSLIAPFGRTGGVVEPHEVNGQPGAILRDRDGKVVNTLALDILDGQIQAIRTVLNPDNLAHVGPVADAWAVLRETTQAQRDHMD